MTVCWIGAMVCLLGCAMLIACQREQGLCCASCGQYMYGSDSVVEPANIWHPSTPVTQGLSCRFGTAVICIECWDGLPSEDRLRYCAKRVLAHLKVSQQDYLWLKEACRASEFPFYKDYQHDRMDNPSSSQ